jgi:hypothetical protein
MIIGPLQAKCNTDIKKTSKRRFRFSSICGMNLFLVIHSNRFLSSGNAWGNR